MRGKFEKRRSKKKSPLGLIALILLGLLVIGVVLLLTLPSGKPGEPTDSTDPTETEPGSSGTGLHIELEEQPAINLGYGLEIIDAGRYTGAYMEDGSDELVSDVMMIVVRNSGEDDIQLAQITAVSQEEEYHFTLTNLAAGEQAVVLERDRKLSTGAALISAVLENPVVFPEPMSLQEDVLEISGLDGMLNVKNISDSDITGDIYIYYKYAAQDVFYGGITFRVCVEGGLGAGELRQLPAGHYSPEGCVIVQVTVNG